MITKQEREGSKNQVYDRLRQMSIFAIIHTAHLLGKNANRELSKMGYSIQLEQIQVLLTVYFMTDVKPSQQDVANMLQKNKAGIQRTIHTLERDGYLRIHPDKQDRRKNLVSTTPAGSIVVERVIESMEKIDSQVKSLLNEEEATLLLRIQDKIRAFTEE
ncbi:MAG: MarR family winged helix-turn-helix transcriptional regulator [Siphonobacter sp.]